MRTCPAGHRTTSDDYCDTCGLPIDTGRPDEATPTPAPATAGARCPNCATLNSPDALFCEACGYDFTTGTLPRTASPPVETEPLATDQATPVAETREAPPVTETREAAPVPESHEIPAPVVQTGPAAAVVETSVAEPAPTPPPAETPPPDQTSPPEPGEPPLGAPSTAESAEDPVPTTTAAEDPVPNEPWEATAAPDPSPGPLTPHGGRLLHPQPTTVEWVAEVWIDPDWYATQGSTDALPSPGLPEVVPLRATSALIGRVSVSRNIHPDIDCDPDTGVSRRHAQVTTDGTRWWIEDLESANGTFVGPSAGPLPTMPIGRGRVEFALDQRLYVGGWTRIVIRRATEDEQQAYN